MASDAAKLAHAVTSHVYTQLPEGPYGDLYDYLGVIDQAASANESIALMHAATVPADKEVGQMAYRHGETEQGSTPGKCSQ